jgi:hypothetical protein
MKNQGSSRSYLQDPSGNRTQCEQPRVVSNDTLLPRAVRSLFYLAGFLLIFIGGGFRTQANPAFFAPAQTSGSLQVKLYPTEGVTPGTAKLVTFGVPFTRGSVTPAQLAQVRVLRNGTEIPAYVALLTPWRHVSNPAWDGTFARIVRIQISHTFAVSYPNFETVTVEWGSTNRTQNVVTFQNPRTAWHQVTSGSYVAADNVFEPDVYAVLPKAHLAQGALKLTRMDPVDDAVTETRDNPTTMDNATFTGFREMDHAQKNFFYSIINEDDPLVTAANRCPYKTDFEPWLYDRASAIYVLYFRSGFFKALREATRAAEFYRMNINANGWFALKIDDLKYVYNENLAYLHWLTADDTPLAKITQVAAKHQSDGIAVRWTPTVNFWTERHTGFRFLSNIIAYEVTGEATYKTRLSSQIADLVWHQNGANGQIPSANRVDGGLYHYGSQHDWDWDETSLGASPWMSLLVMDPMLRAYALTESTDASNFLRRCGTFLRASLRLTGEHNYPPDEVWSSRYAILYDGTTGQENWGDEEHSLEVGAGLAWSYFFGDAASQQPALDLYETYDEGVNHWTRPAGPASGLTAYRVSPWRKYGWEYRPSGSFSWAIRQETDTPADTDGDGMPDTWETTYSLNPNSSADALQDADGDGATNLAEYVAGTNPQNVQSRLATQVLPAPTPGQFLVRFNGVAGKTYSVRYKNALTDASWTKLTDVPAPAENGDITVTDSSSAGIPQRFYQVVTPQQP